jgi:hypothetical protein
LSNKAVFEAQIQAAPVESSQVRIVEEMYKENSFNVIDLESKNESLTCCGHLKLIFFAN